jgi:hypothetical protein
MVAPSKAARAAGVAGRQRHPLLIHGSRTELFTVLDDPAMPADNNGTLRAIRSLAAARSDGGTHRVDWSATAFARLKSVIVTGMKNQVRFIQYGNDVVRAKLRGARLPSPWLQHRTPASRSKPSAGREPGGLSTLTSRASTARPRPSTGSGPGHHAHLPRPARPPLYRQPDAATMIVRAGHASSITRKPGGDRVTLTCYDEEGGLLLSVRSSR